MQEPASKKEATPVLTENFGLTRDYQGSYAFLCPSLGSPSADMKTQDQRRPFIFVPARDLQRSGCSVSMTDRTRRFSAPATRHFCLGVGGAPPMQRRGSTEAAVCEAQLAGAIREAAVCRPSADMKIQDQRTPVSSNQWVVSSRGYWS